MPTAALSSAADRARVMIGTATAATIPMIATTISSSIRVKPVSEGAAVAPCPAPVATLVEVIAGPLLQ